MNKRLISQTVKAAIVLALVCIAAVTAAMYLHKPPIDGEDYARNLLLQHVGTLLIVLLLAWDIVKGCMPLPAFVGISVFAVIHIVGACYLYSYVPYARWFEENLGIVLEQTDIHPNKFDRFVHFAFGVLMFPYLLHKCLAWLKGKPWASVLMAWLLIQTGSMIYELVEWLLAVCQSPENAEAYNGQQGDVWDAHKDMLLAMIGSTIMTICYAIKNMRETRSRWPKCQI